ncbi:hypothetical protein SE17_14270 [Kouleothrix aurantiaca]|uniref:Uncharacterized protein n=1 Tax=Kouleothrix aurantiaca TaxID=186479 RepID=A0A0P9D3R1_9CHLR|nr:hypothetical protein SE17_14270 [Kouleothrix aurantiaca]
MSTTPITTLNPPDAEITQAQRDMEATMLDTCIVHTRAEDVQDEYGMPGSDWSDSQPTRCGYRTASRREVLGIAQALVFDSVARCARKPARRITKRVEPAVVSLS